VEVLMDVSIFMVIHSLRQRCSLGLPSWQVVTMLPSDPHRVLTTDLHKS
jgi:hypothetical protein